MATEGSSEQPQTPRFRSYWAAWLRGFLGQQVKRETHPQTPVDLKMYLLQASQSEKHPAEPLPSSIDLGAFGREAERLVDLTNSDPEHAEYASVAYLDDVGRVLIAKNPIRGNENAVQLPSPNGKRRLLLTHSHPVDTPFSPTDLSALFVPATESVSAPALLLATPTLKMLILRTKATPILSPLEILDVTTMMFHDYGVEDEVKLYSARFEVDGGEDNDRIPPFTDDSRQALRQLSHKRMFMLSRVAHHYSLAAYACPIDQNIVYSVM